MNRTGKKTTMAVFAALALAGWVAGAARASGDDDSRAGAGPVSGEHHGAPAALTIQEVLMKLRDAGYTDVTEVERERDRYEIKGRDAGGKRVELYVDARTGGVLKEERDD